MSVGVIGAGVFGVATALELQLTGASVTVYEQRDNLLAGTTGRNLFRVHRGYHYPRHRATAEEARDSYFSFAESFSGAISARVPHHYAIASQQSMTTVDAFVLHCEQLGLRADPVHLSCLNPVAIEGCFEVDEDYFDVSALRKIAWERLNAARVKVTLGSTVHASAIAQAHDFVVIASYNSMNEVLIELGCATMPLQYELCEVPIISSPGFRRSSVVVMDGPFVSIAPYGSDLHLLYDVENSVHERVVADRRPEFGRLRRQTDGPPISVPSSTRFDSILASTRQFIKLDEVRHVGSLYSERVVLPGLEGTDARPTLVEWVSPRVLAIFSGKVSVSVAAARSAARAITQGYRSSPEAQLDRPESLNQCDANDIGP